MKKVAFIALISLMTAACSNEPKLNKEEETAVENQLQSDQKAQDSLEAAIMAQMAALDNDSDEMDSL